MLKTIIQFTYANAQMEKEKQHNILKAAYYGDVEELRRALDEFPEAINVRDSFTGATALHIAAGIGNLSCVEVLAGREGIDAHAKDYEGKYAVDKALDIGHYVIADLISNNLMYPEGAWDVDGGDEAPSNVVSLGPR